MAGNRRLSNRSGNDEADQNLLQYLFSNSPVPCQLHFASNGVDGSDFAFRRGDYQRWPSPDLILVDLNIPKKDGKEIINSLTAFWFKAATLPTRPVRSE